MTAFAPGVSRELMSIVRRSPGASFLMAIELPFASIVSESKPLVPLTT